MTKKAYKEVILSVYAEPETPENYDIHVVSEKQFDFNGTLSVDVMDFSGN